MIDYAIDAEASAAALHEDCVRAQLARIVAHYGVRETLAMLSDAVPEGDISDRLWAISRRF